jgi:predicted HTH transcriptional regulator
MTPESHRLEYKQELTNDLEKEAVAFLNAGGGKVYFGICDDGRVIGVSDPDTIQLQIKDRMVNNIRPGTLGLFDLFVEEIDGKQVVVLNLAGGPSVPYYIRKYGRSEKGCFLRIGSASQPMTEEHIEQLLNRRQPASLTNVVSRHQDLTFQQLKIFYEGKGVVLNQRFAKTLDLTAPDGKFNQLAYLFADENRISIRIAKWWGADKMHLRENEEYGDCSLVKAMQMVLDKFDIENVTQARKRGMKTREELRLVDPASLRELIINAFAHNDYSNGDTPIFEIFANRFEITSYGGLVMGMTQEEFFGGVSRPRNPEIMRIFKDLEYVERLGSGVPSVVEKYGRGIFNFSSSIIRFVLPFAQTPGESSEETEKSSEETEKSSEETEKSSEETEESSVETEKSSEETEKSSEETEKSSVETGESSEETEESSEETEKSSEETEKSSEETEKSSEETEESSEETEKSSEKILRLIADNPEISSKEIASILNMTQRGVEKTIAKLKAAGQLRRIGPNKGGRWETIP